ncbi:hypothetical protein [Natrinema halophilum]|nr:hypothetical protein [Natrinema halophilum]QLG51111.2 hypothetical protein HYG82_01120 [Natrinema halophilum]
MDTQQMTESTMNQGQQAMEQLIDLQRDMVRMSLSALKWQESAQKQGLEMTKSMLENAPSQQLTESMMQSYVQGVEAMLPEMEQVMEQGFEAAAQPQMNQMEQMGGQMEQMGRQLSESGQRSHQEPTQRGSRGQMDTRVPGTERKPSGSRQPDYSTSERGATSSQGLGQQTGTPTGQRTGSETGEWITPGEYGGESAGASGAQQEPMSAAPGGQFEQEQQQSPHTQPRGPQQTQYGGPATSETQRRREQEAEQSAQRGGATQPQTGQGAPPERYSQRIEGGRRERGRTSRKAPQSQQGPAEQSDVRSPEEERPEDRVRGETQRRNEHNRGETQRSRETSAGEEQSSNRSQQQPRNGRDDEKRKPKRR